MKKQIICITLGMLTGLGCSSLFYLNRPPCEPSPCEPSLYGQPFTLEDPGKTVVVCKGEVMFMMERGEE